MVEPNTSTPEVEETSEPEATLLEEELLVEDVSIDGMCGVY
jgi:mycofactocin precursor